MDTIDPEDLEEISLSLADSNVGTEVTSDARPEERRRVEAILHRTIREFFSKTPLSSGAFSVTVDLTEFPPTLFERNAATLLRPVMIDACAVSNCFDQKYSSYWGKIRNTEMVSWHSCKVLRLKPIFKCLVHFLLLGHKVSILLPKYYRSSPCSEMRPKVDNVKAFNLLMNLNLLRFIEPEDPEKTDTIKGVVNRFDGLLVSSPACTDSEKEIPSQLSPSSNACNLPEHPSSTNVSERMATPIFFGRNHEAMCMMFDYQVNEGGTWGVIPKNLCVYELGSNRNIDDVEKVQQQLLFEDQAHLLDSIYEAYEWNVAEFYGIASVLRLKYLSNLFP